MSIFLLSVLPCLSYLRDFVTRTFITAIYETINLDASHLQYFRVVRTHSSLSVSLLGNFFLSRLASVS